MLVMPWWGRLLKMKNMMQFGQDLEAELCICTFSLSSSLSSWSWSQLCGFSSALVAVATKRGSYMGVLHGDRTEDFLPLQTEVRFDRSYILSKTEVKFVVRLVP